MGILSGSSDFDKFLDKATSQLQLEPDWAMILQICDCIRQEDVNAKYAVAAIKKKIFDPNPHVAQYALTVLEACVKNCGSSVHKEVATKQFVEELRNLLKTSPEPVKEKVLELIQIWSQAFRNEPKYKIVQDTYNLMKMEGHKFPAVNASDAMFVADSAPEWSDGDVCNMCRVKFGMVQRQHHCRNCGQVFCGKCSAKTSIIPQYGIEREVRVCDPCYYKLNPARKEAEKSKKSPSGSSAACDNLPAEYLNSTLAKESQLPVSQRMSEQEMKEQEEDELQLAMALSMSENSQDSKRPSSRSSSDRTSGSPYGSTRSSQPSSGMYSPVADVEPDSSDVDPELARYLNRSYWEDKRDGRVPATAAPPSSSQSSGHIYNKHGDPIKSSLKSKKKKKEKKRDIQENGVRVAYAVNKMDEESMEENSDVLVGTFKNSVEMLLQRMQACSSRGKHIAMDSSVQSLFQTISAMHPQLLRLIEGQEQEKAKYEALQEKLGLVREARVTLDAMRDQHREKVRQQELEQDMLRRIQIEQKLELMRQQKADYLAYQKRLEAERQLVLEQQQQQLQQQYRAAQQYIGPVHPGGGSPYSSLTYIPPPPPGSAPGMQTQIPPPQYPQAGQMPPQGAPSYQAQEAQAPPQYPQGTQSQGSYQPPEGYNYPMASDKGPYLTEYPEPRPPSTVEYPYTNQQQQPPQQASYPPNLTQQQYQQQPFASGTAPRTTAPSPPQYGQVTAQQQPSAAPYSGNEYQPGGLSQQHQQQFSPPRTQTPPPPQYPSQLPLQQQQASQMLPAQQDPSQAQYQPPPLGQEIPAQPIYPGALPSGQQQQPVQGDYAGPPAPQQQQQQQQQQPLYQQGPPPPQYPGPQQPMQQFLPPGQQFPPPGQQPPPQGQQPPPQGQQPLPPGHQPPPQGQQAYGPPEGQYHSYQQQPPQQHQQAGPPPQRQLSDLELISFD